MNTPSGSPPGKFATTITLGSKGQIVIPKAARDLVGLQPGDSALLLADAEQGIVIVRQELFQDFIASTMGGHTQPPATPPSPKEEP